MTCTILGHIDSAELDAAKQRIAELTVERDNFDKLLTLSICALQDYERSALGEAAKAMLANAHRTGFLACQKLAVELVWSWHEKQQSQFLVFNVAQAISQLKPEGNNAAD